MRVTIESDVDTLVLGGTRLWDTPGWWLQASDPVEGWWPVPDPRVETAEVPQQDGDYFPALVNVSRRIVTVRGVRIGLSSSLEVHDAMRRLNALVKRTLTLSVEDGGGVLSSQCYMSSGAEMVMRHSEDVLEFSLILTCPDPVKYGPPVAFPVSGGTVSVENTGTADVFPTFRVDGAVSSLQVSLGGAVVSWRGSANGLTLDCRTGFPVDSSGRLVGTLIDDDLFKIPPGVSKLSVKSDGNVSVEVRPGWW